MVGKKNCCEKENISNNKCGFHSPQAKRHFYHSTIDIITVVDGIVCLQKKNVARFVTDSKRSQQENGSHDLFTCESNFSPFNFFKNFFLCVLC